MAKVGRKPKYPQWVQDLINTQYKRNPERWIITHYYDMDKDTLRLILKRHNELVKESLNTYMADSNHDNYWEFRKYKNCCACIRCILDHEYQNWNNCYNNEFLNHVLDVNSFEPAKGIYSNNEGDFYHISINDDNDDETEFVYFKNNVNNPTIKDTKSIYKPRDGIYSMNDDGEWIKE